jgi:hypothetical protein
LRDLGLDASGSYELSDVLDSAQQVGLTNGSIDLNAQPPHSVRLLKISNRSVAAAPPAIVAHVPAEFPVDVETEFAAEPQDEQSTATIYHWHFDDGVTTDGRRVRHAYTLPGAHHLTLHVESADGAPYAKTFNVNVTGHVDTHFQPQNNRRYGPGETQPH